MKTVFLLIFFLQFCILLFSQTLDELITRINKSDKSFKQVTKILDRVSLTKKKTIYDTTSRRYRHADETTLPGLDKILISKRMMVFYTYSTELFYWKKVDSFPGRIASSADVELIYRNNGIASIVIIDNNKIDETRKIFIPDTCFRYCDTVFIKSELDKYNFGHYTYFDSVDFFDPDIITQSKYQVARDGRFSIIPGCCGGGISSEALPYIPLIENRDLRQIVLSCKSLSPVRKTYGAFCLYYLQKEGYPLSDEEKWLMERIICSDQKIPYSSGCFGFPPTEISKILTYREIEVYCEIVKDYIAEKGRIGKQKSVRLTDTD